MNNKLLKNSLIYAVGEITPRLFSFITFPLLTSFLTTEEYGILNYVNTIDIFLMVFGMLSLNTYFLVHYYKVETEIDKQKLLGNLTIFIFVYNLFFAVILLLFGNSFFRAIGSQVSFFPYIAIGVVTNIFNCISILPAALYRVKEHPLPLTILNVLKGLLVMIGTVIVVTSGYFNDKLQSVLYIRLFFPAIFSIIFLISSNKYTIYSFNLKQIVQALKFSLPILPGALGYYLFTLSDRILIERFLSLSKLGIYATAANLAILLDIVSNSAYRAFEPYFYKIMDNEDFDKEFIKVRNALLWVVLFCASAIAFFSKEFVYMFAEKGYYSAYLYVPILLIGTVLNSMGLMYSTIIVGRGDTSKNTYITIVCAVFSILCNIFLIPHIGLYGAALVFAVSFVVMLIAKIKVSLLNIEHLSTSLAVLFTFITLSVVIYYFDLDVTLFNFIIKVVLLVLITFINQRILRVNFNVLKRRVNDAKN